MSKGIYSPRCSIVLTYPNKTTLTIEGDIEIVKQIVDILDNKEITWHEFRNPTSGAN